MRSQIIAISLALALGPALVHAEEQAAGAKGENTESAEPVAKVQGDASYYDDKFQGRKTAAGETFSQQKLTAASKDLPLGSRVTVTNEENGKSVEVKVNDRGPYVDGRVIDLSKKAAQKIGLTKSDGIAPVKVEARPSAQPTEELKQAVREKAETLNGVEQADAGEPGDAAEGSTTTE